MITSISKGETGENEERCCFAYELIHDAAEWWSFKLIINIILAQLANEL